MAKEPKILVKKSDGSTVHMTMSEFKEYKNQQNNKSNPAKNQKSGSNLDELPEEVIEIDVSELSPVQKLPEEVIEFSFEDIASVAEGPQKKLVNSNSLSSKDTHVNESVSALLNKLSFSIPEEMYGRLSSLVDSRRKEVRTDEQIKNYLERQKNKGGLGLTPEQSKEIVEKIHIVYNIAPESPIAAKAKKDSTKKPNLEPKKIYVSGPLPAFKKPKPHSDPSYDMVNQGGIAKPYMQDIKPPEPVSQFSGKRSLGPVDELGIFTLKDLRRLSSNPEGQIKLLQGKVQTLKEDSYLLYVNGVKAWYNSPIYKQYNSVLKQALEEEMTLQDVLERQTDNGLTKDEMITLATFNSSIS